MGGPKPALPWWFNISTRSHMCFAPPKKISIRVSWVQRPPRVSLSTSAACSEGALVMACIACRGTLKLMPKSEARGAGGSGSPDVERENSDGTSEPPMRVFLSFDFFLFFFWGGGNWMKLVGGPFGRPLYTTKRGGTVKKGKVLIHPG